MYKGKFVLKNLTEEELKDFLVEIGEKNSGEVRYILGYTGILGILMK